MKGKTMTKKISITARIEFEAGDNVCYCPQLKDENSKTQDVTIQSVHVSVGITQKGKRSQVKYKTNHKDVWGYMRTGLVSAKNLYRSKTEVCEAERNYKKKALQKKAAKNRAIMRTKQNEIKKLQVELDEIKKEELIEDLSGISTKKKKKK